MRRLRAAALPVAGRRRLIAADAARICRRRPSWIALQEKLGRVECVRLSTQRGKGQSFDYHVWVCARDLARIVAGYARSADRTRWTADELRFLRRHVGFKSFAWIAGRLGRSPRMIKYMAYDEGLATLHGVMLSRGRISSGQLARLAGKTIACVKYWASPGRFDPPCPHIRSIDGRRWFALPEVIAWLRTQPRILARMAPSRCRLLRLDDIPQTEASA